MSRIGRKPIDIPGGVEISVKPGEVTVKGPKGELVQEISPDMTVKVDGDVVTVERPTDRGPHRALHGLTRSLVANMIEGVTNGYEKTLEIQGVGYRAALAGRDLNLTLGFSHPVLFKAPEGVTLEVPTQTEILIKGADKQVVGEAAAKIRSFRPPEPYKGKGVRYSGEKITMKEAKKA